VRRKKYQGLHLCIKNKERCCCSSIHNQSILSNLRYYFHLVSQFFGRVKYLYAAALNIETLCIAAAEIGENTALYLFGFNWISAAVVEGAGIGFGSFGLRAQALIV
jgi:hypothetical protein